MAKLSARKLAQVDRAIRHAAKFVEIHQAWAEAGAVALNNLAAIKSEGHVSPESKANLKEVFELMSKDNGAASKAARQDLARAWDRAQQQTLN